MAVRFHFERPLTWQVLSASKLFTHFLLSQPRQRWVVLAQPRYARVAHRNVFLVPSYRSLTETNRFLCCRVQMTTDPHTGQQKVKKRLGGAYPGQKIPQHSPYVPPASAFGKDGQATAHFVAYGGGNALTLVQSDGSTAPQVGKYQPEYIQGMSGGIQILKAAIL